MNSSRRNPLVLGPGREVFGEIHSLGGPDIGTIELNTQKRSPGAQRGKLNPITDFNWRSPFGNRQWRVVGLGRVELPTSGEQTIMAIAGHLSRTMLQHYSHIRMAAKRAAVDAIAPRQAPLWQARESVMHQQSRVGNAESQKLPIC